MGLWGDAASHPRRQRGGGRRWSAVAWQGEEGTARGIEVVGSFDAMHGRPTQAGGGPGMALSGGSSAALLAVRESREAGWRWKKGLVCNFRNSRDPTINQQ